jgi:adenylate cyclase class 2
MAKAASTSLERELKFRTEGLEVVRERLVDLEAERLGPAHFEDNLILDREGELEKHGCLLRLRADGRGVRVTYKGPRLADGHVKVRVEHETSVGDLPRARAIFESLGYRVVRRYQKVREEWRLGGVEVALDHTPMGDFVEIEGDRAEVLAKRFNLDPAKAEQRSYLRLYDDYRRDHPEMPEEMIFPDEGEAAR